MTRKKRTKVLRYLRPYWWIALLAALAMVGEVICDLELPMHMAKIIDIGIKKNQMSVIYEHGIYMLLIAIAGSIGGFLSALFGFFDFPLDLLLEDFFPVVLPEFLVAGLPGFLVDLEELFLEVDFVEVFLTSSTSTSISSSSFFESIFL